MISEEEARHPLVWTVDHRPGTEKETPVAEAKLSLKIEPDLAGFENIGTALRAFGEAAIQLADALQGRGEDTDDGTAPHCPATLRNEAHTGHFRGDSRTHCPGLPYALPVALCPVGEKHLPHHWTLAVALSGPQRVLCSGDGQDTDSAPDDYRSCPLWRTETAHASHSYGQNEGVCPGV